jgi:hypothetical protein
LHTFLTIYFAVSLIATAFIITAGYWFGRMRWRVVLPAKPIAAVADPSTFDSATDVRTAVIAALKRLMPILASREVRADVAVPPGLLVRMPGGVLEDLLEDLLATTIQRTPASRVLLASSLRGAQVQISVSDDAAGADLAERRGCFRQMSERVALNGGALDFDVRPAEGTIMTLRLAAAPALSRELDAAERSVVEAEAVTAAEPEQFLPIAAAGRHAVNG